MRSTAILLMLTISALIVGIPKQASADIPNAPSDFKSTFVNNTSVKLEWVDNSTNESGFKIFMGESPFPPQLIQTVSPGTRQYTVTGLTCQSTGGPAHTYKFELAATNGDGDAYASNSVTATTLNCLVSNPVKVAGWIRDFWGITGLNGVKVQYYQGGQLLGTATSTANRGYDGYFAMDVQRYSWIRLVATTPVGCYNFNTTLDFTADEAIVPTVPGEFPTIQSSGINRVLVDVDYHLTNGTCNFWSGVPFWDVSLSVWEYKADNTAVHRIISQDPHEAFYFDFEVDCNSDIVADLQGLPYDASFTPTTIFMEDITSYKRSTFQVDVPQRTVKGKLLAPDGTSPLAGVTLTVDWSDCGDVSIVTQADGTFQFANGPDRPLTWGYEDYLTSMYPGMSETYIHFLTSSPEEIIDLGTCPILTNVQATCDSPSGAGLDATGFYYQHGCRVTWTTNFPTSSQVEYSEIPNPYHSCDPLTPNHCWITTPEIVTPTTNHQVYIEGWKQNTRYAVRAISGSSRGPVQIVTTKSAFTDISQFTFHQSLTDDEPPQVLVTCGFNTGVSASCAIHIRRHQLNPLKFGTAATTEATADPHGTDHSHDFTEFYPWGSQTPTPLALGSQYDLVITVWPDHWFPADPAAPNAQYPDGYNGYTATQIYRRFTTPRADGTGGQDPDFSESAVENLVVQVPKESYLLGNSPNPVISTTAIRFYVKEDSDVRLDVYDIQGRLVKTLANDVMKMGLHQVEWDRRGESGEIVNSGIYFYRLKVEGFTETKKMLVMR